MRLCFSFPPPPPPLSLLSPCCHLSLSHDIFCFHTGWWFVRVEEDQGWVPASYLEPADGGISSSRQVQRLRPGEGQCITHKRCSFVCFYACHSMCRSLTGNQQICGCQSFRELLTKHSTTFFFSFITTHSLDHPTLFCLSLSLSLSLSLLSLSLSLSLSLLLYFSSENSASLSRSVDIDLPQLSDDLSLLHLLSDPPTTLFSPSLNIPFSVFVSCCGSSRGEVCHNSEVHR